MSNINGQGMGGRTPGMRYYNMRGEHDRPHGEAYHGTKGTIFCDRIGYEIFTGGEPQRKNTTDATGRHAQHFVACIRGLEKPRATALSGHRATNIAHLGNLALDVGRKLRWDAQREECTGDPAATRLLGREARTGWKLI
jgi:hypothetical protein